jgi:hypothetical protein
LAALRGEHLGQPAALTAAYAATVRSLVAVQAVARLAVFQVGFADESEITIECLLTG